VFRTSIQIPHGMSGGPVFEKSRDPSYSGFVVCGVAYSDNNDPGEAYTCSSAVNALHLQTNPPHAETVLDWLKAGKILWAGIDPDRWCL
jgi:hypothetical protein